MRGQITVMQEEIAKSDLIIAELNMTIEDLREYNARLEHDIQYKDGKIHIVHTPLAVKYSAVGPLCCEIRSLISA